MVLITYQELVEATGYTTPSEVVAHLKDNQIRFHRGKHGRPYTWLSEFEQTQTNKPQEQHIRIV